MKQLYLASNSPRRQALLKQIGLTFSIIQVDVDETPLCSEQPEDYVERLSIMKAQAGFQQLSFQQQTNAYIIGADTTVTINKEILGKPNDQEEAILMLNKLSGNTHSVFTAVSVYYRNECITEVVKTDVTMRSITEQEAINYWLTGEPKDKAGGYAIQGLASVFIEKIVGDYYNVVGLPIFATSTLLQQVGISPFNENLKGYQ